jgi:putative ATP-binding cassette transporter
MTWNESSSRFGSLFAHDLRANASRLSRGKPLHAFPDHALASRRKGGAKLVSDVDLIPRKGRRRLLGHFLRQRKL